MSCYFSVAIHEYSWQYPRPLSMSISRVAKLAGVSTATVSRVMNRRSLVSDETVQKVQHAMKRAGYRPAPPAERRGPKAKLHLPLRHNTIAFFRTAGRQPAQTLTGAGL